MNPEISSNSNQDEARQRVRHLRQVGRIPQGQVAAGVGLDTGRFCLWETGRISLRPAQVAAIQASLLDVIAERLQVLKGEFTEPEETTV